MHRPKTAPSLVQVVLVPAAIVTLVAATMWVMPNHTRQPQTHTALHAADAGVVPVVAPTRSYPPGPSEPSSVSPEAPSDLLDYVASGYAASDTGSPIFREVETWKRSEHLPNSSTLMVGDDQRLPLEAMQVHARIDGFRARVLVDLFYYNDQLTTLEGRLKLRLPDGATPFYVAFGATELEHREDVPSLLRQRATVQHSAVEPGAILAARVTPWDVPREGRMVTREAGGFAYRETVRAQIDPALLEWAGPSVFSTRVYPIEPEQVHHIVVGYDMDLTRTADALEAQIPIPADVGQAVVDIDVAALPQVEVEVSPRAPVELVDGRKTYRYTDVVGKVVVVRQKVRGAAMLTGADETGAYFALRATPELPDAVEGPGKPRAVFLVDTSLSANPDHFNRALAQLAAVLDGNRDAAGGIEEFAVCFFDVDARWWRDELVANTPAQVDAVLAYANTLALEGATDLERGLAAAVAPPWSPSGDGAWDIFLLSDGAITWGESDPFALSRTLAEGSGHAVFAYTASASSDVLDHLARHSNGAVFTVRSDDEVAAAARAHRAQPWALVDVQLAGTEDILVAGAPFYVYPGQPLLIVGRGTPTEDSSVRLSMRRRGDEQAHIIAMPAKTRLSSTLAPRIFGGVAVAQLEPLRAAKRAETAAFARHFRIVGKSASLLMLESDAEYEAFGLAPEDDAAVVASTQASALVVEALAAIGERLGDPKAAFRAHLDVLTALPDLAFHLPAEVEAMLESLPSSAFAVHRARLAQDDVAASALSPDYRGALQRRDFSAGDVEGEALRRVASGHPCDGLRALSTQVEHNPGDAVVLRDVAYRAMEWGYPGEAYQLLRKVAESRPHEPQGYHGMALALADEGHIELAAAWFEVALAGRWDDRFGEFRTIAAVDYVRLLNQLARGERGASDTLLAFAPKRAAELTAELDFASSGLLVTMGWNTDRTDVDLHVVEPTGEVCNYQHTKTKLGGRITKDVTQGFGPEMYVLPKPRKGTYEIQAKYYSDDALRTSTTTKIYVTVYERWGQPDEQVTREVLALESKGEVQRVMLAQVE